MANEGHVVTGHQGVPHVSSADAGLFNAGVIGTGKYVLNTGGHFSAATTSNTITIQPGDLVNQGRHISMQEVHTLTIENAPVGYTRKDRITMRYRKDSSSMVESADLVVIQGTPAVTNPVSPEIVSGSIFDGELIDDFLLYEIVVNEGGISSISTKFSLQAALSQANANISTLQTALSRANSNISALQTALSQANSNISALQTALNNATAVSSTDATENTGNAAMSAANIKQCRLRKVGKTVFCNMIIYTTQSAKIPNNTTLFTIPNGYRPASDHLAGGLVCVASDNSMRASRFHVKTNGIIDEADFNNCSSMSLDYFWTTA